MDLDRERIYECIFCDGKVSSGEHLLSEWVWKDLHDLGSPGEHLIFSPRAEAPYAVMRGKLGRGEHSAKKLKCVCKPCNNEWMSRIEKTAAPVFRRIKEAPLCELSPDDRLQIARWATLKAMVLEFTGPHRTIPGETRERFMQDHNVPDSWIIAVGRYSGQQSYPQLFTQSFSVQRSDEEVGAHEILAQSIMFEAGGLITYVLATNNVQDLEFLVSDPADHCSRHGMRLVWPTDGLELALVGISVDDVALEYLMYPWPAQPGIGPFTTLLDGDPLKTLGQQLVGGGLTQIDLRKCRSAF
ncbi:hypothetical protein [uncultured Novosphingobium sp.]|uniref:hypothetical protein n=1 Tax=uncultured Novosphingobium sp. TaxID=292277 RepID=UPI0037483E98